MPENNRRQAFIPEGSRPIPNPVGTAPGFIAQVGGTPVVCLPGVPRELKYLMENEILPWIHQTFRLEEHHFTYRTLKAVGIGESKVDQIIGDLMAEGAYPEVGLLASMGEIKIRIAARAQNEAEAEAVISPVEREIRARLGRKIFGRDNDTLEAVIDAQLAKNDLTLAVLETFSGGVAAQRFHQVPLRQLLESHVLATESRLAQFAGVEKVECDEDGARHMAGVVRDEGHADIGLAILGFAEEKRPGYAVNAYTSALGPGIEKQFAWKMGGDVKTLQQRGGIIGLNTLRLALLDAFPQKGQA
jgi:nicotinamide-nucleotide amidase